MTRKSLYFVATLIPEPWRSEISVFQEYADEHFHSKAALRTPPHITLIPPFHATEDQYMQITDALSEVCEIQRRFEISLDGFNSFGKRVIYIQVSPVTELKALADLISQALRSRKVSFKTEDRHYHPHVTIAYKDLGTEVFDEAYTHYRQTQFSATVAVESVTLLRHQHGRWHVVENNAFS